MEEPEKLRKELDLIDEKLVRVLEKRVRLARKIIEYKKQNNWDLTDLDREKRIIENLASKSGLERRFIEKIYREIFSFVKNS